MHKYMATHIHTTFVLHVHLTSDKGLISLTNNNSREKCSPFMNLLNSSSVKGGAGGTHTKAFFCACVNARWEQCAGAALMWWEKDTALAWLMPTNTATQRITLDHSRFSLWGSPKSLSIHGYSRPIKARDRNNKSRERSYTVSQTGHKYWKYCKDWNTVHSYTFPATDSLQIAFE